MTKLKIGCLFIIILVFLIFIDTILSVLFGDSVDKFFSSVAIVMIAERIVDWFLKGERE